MKRGTVAHQALTMLLPDEPLGLRQVIERMADTYGPAILDLNQNTVAVALRELEQRGAALTVGKQGTARLRVITPEGRRLLTAISTPPEQKQRRLTVRAGSLPFHVLHQLCGEPLTTSQLAGRLSARGVECNSAQVSTALHGLRGRQLAYCVNSNHYVISPEGEAMLDALWEQRTAA